LTAPLDTAIGVAVEASHTILSQSLQIQSQQPEIGLGPAVALEAGGHVLDQLAPNHLQHLAGDHNRGREHQEADGSRQGYGAALKASVDQAADKERQDRGQSAGQEHYSESKRQPLALSARELLPEADP
jgi:hypothetical protein